VLENKILRKKFGLRGDEVKEIYHSFIVFDVV